MASISVADLADVNIPPEAQSDTEPGEHGLQCENCGRTFEHTGRGRKPKQCPECRAEKRTTRSATGSRRSTSKDVETALAVLDSTYSTVAVGLLMVSPKAAGVWAEQLDQLQTTNRLTLAGDPNLTKTICRAGERSGKAMFFLAHVMALAPVVMTVRAEMPARKKRENKAPAQPQVPEWEPSVDTTIGNADFFG